MFKRIRRTLCLIMAMLLMGMPWAGAAETVSSGSRTFKLVTVPMDGACAGQIVTAGGSVNQDMAASELIQTAVSKYGGTVVAAVNGLFFNSYYSQSAGLSFPGNCPLILTNLIQDGEILAGNGRQNSIGFTKDGKVKIDVVDVRPQAYVNGRGPVNFWTVNGANAQADAVILITDAMTLPYTVPAGSAAYLVVDGVVARQVSGAAITLKAGQKLMVFNSAAVTSHSGWSLLPKAGDSVTFKTQIIADSGEDWSNMTSIAGGGRMLVHNGAVVSGDASYNAILDTDPKQNATGVYQRSFAAVMSNGTLLLGTGTASFNEIAAYLKQRGAVDAVSLDGGASSMLYEGGRGFVTSAGRKLASAIVFVKPAASAVSCSTVINGENVAFDAYNINWNNYFKLRDFAYAVSGSAKQFDVYWDNAHRSVALTSGSAYTPVGGELSPSALASAGSIRLNQAPLYKDGEQIFLTAYTINGNNYFKLRDLCAVFDIKVDWDASTGLVTVDSQ